MPHKGSPIYQEHLGLRTNPLQPAFLARPTAEQSNFATGSDITVVFGTEVFDQNNDFASNTFTAPVDGRYQFNAILYLLSIDSAAISYAMKIITSNRTFENFMRAANIYGADSTGSILLSITTDLDASDTAYVTIRQTAGAAQTDITTKSAFSGYLVA